jgi:NAD(P)-dependent dehydrogenase (short-subunit alcohol dehydrogenase family)
MTTQFRAFCRTGQDELSVHYRHESEVRAGMIDYPEHLLAERPGIGRLTGRTVIVSGGGSSGPGLGNGRASAIVLAREGAAVVVADINLAAAQETVAAIETAGGVAVAVAADATVDVQCRDVVTAAVDRFGRVDVLVNSIGVIGPPSSVVDVDPDLWDDMLRVNIKPIMLMSRHAIPAMRGGGSIVNLSSIAAIRVTERAAYAAAKGGVIALTTTMAGQHGAAGIRVNSVCPGAAWTPIATAGIDEPAELERLRDSRRRANLLHAEGAGWDIAYAVLFFATDESRWITGQTLVVDGGMTSSCRSPDITVAGSQHDATDAPSWRW